MKITKTFFSLSSGFVRWVQFIASVNSWKSKDPLPSTSKTLENKIGNYSFPEILKLFLKCKRQKIVIMHNAQYQDQTNSINIELIIHQSQNLSKIAANVTFKTFKLKSLQNTCSIRWGYLNNEFGLKTILLLKISKNSSSFIFPSG